ncbi:MAG: hypothetical protein JXQ72_14060 [Anaerolineae bacterium]|nr:hypothetical protein [Anaerolineae bacterium]
MRKNTFIRFILSNLGWLAASLALALVIWIAAKMDSNPVQQDEIKSVPVAADAILLPDGYVLASAPPSTVTAIVRAERSEWNLLLPGDILITADLTEQVNQPGEYRVELEAEVASPLHGRVVALRPSSLVLQVDEQAEARMAIQVVVSREPPLGYTYPPDLACEETEVVVRGSAAKVADVARIEARLNLSNDRNPTTKTVNLTAVRESELSFRSTDLELTPASVECFVDIQTREGVTPVEVLPDRGGTSPPEGYLFEGYTDIAPNTVGVTGSQDAIQAMNQVIKTTRIDLSAHTETFTTEVPLVLPDGVSLVTENQLVSVTVLISPVRGNREFQDVPVEITGLDQTLYRATGLVETVTVNIAGPLIQLPDRENVRVLVDLSGLSPGNHQVEPEGLIMGEGGDDMTISVIPAQISVTIEALNPTPSPSPEATVLPAGRSRE